MKNVSWFEFRGEAGGFRITLKKHLGSIKVASESKASRLVGALNKVVREASGKKKFSGARSRRKGHQFERDVAILFRRVFPEARRHLEYHSSDANGVDLIETGPYRVQCKKFKGYAPLSAIKEIQYEEFLGEIPVLVTAADNEPALACLPLTEFLRLLREVHGGRVAPLEDDSE